jgi:hypothetical protein
MRKFNAFVLSEVLFATSLIALSAPGASAKAALITCTDISTGKTIVLKEAQENCRPFQAAAIWRVEQSDTSINSADASATLKVCSSQNPLFSYKFIKSKCPKFQITTDYRRAVVKPQTPIVITAVANGHSVAALQIAPDTSTIRMHVPIAYYLVTNLTSNEITRVIPDFLNRLVISGLNPLTVYTFQVAAVSIDGRSPLSLITPEIRTTAVPVTPVAPAAAPALAAPAFTLSSTAETKTVNNAISGYIITSTGGAIDSYSISPAAPAGLTFSTTTGFLSGTPTSVASTTAYTITATNASGSATRTFTLTITAIVYAVGDTGPGGGRIFYVAPVGTTFACDSTRGATCSYLEAAPALWNGGSSDPSRTWAQATPVKYDTATVNNASSPETATATAIGWGYFNTRAIILQGNIDSTTSAAALADSYSVIVSGIVYDDWYLASRDELNQMCKWVRGITGVDLTNVTTVCTGGAINTGLGAAGFGDVYWSSSQTAAHTALYQNFFNPVRGGVAKNYSAQIRPIRAF